MIDYRIKTFLTLCDCMNYRKAADLLMMTQPAVTQHIQRLEHLYGCSLFLYDRKKLVLTKEGELLKRYAQNVMYQEEKLLENIRLIEKKPLRIGATKTIGEYVIPEQIARFLQNPTNHIFIDVDNTGRLLEQLQNGALDFALVEGFFDSNLFASKHYRSEPFVGICSAKHPFAGRTVPLNEIFYETLFIREEDSGTRMIFEQLLSAHNRTLEQFTRTICISNFGLMRALISENCGISFAYKVVQDGSDQLACFQIKNWDITRDFNYVFLDTPNSRKSVALFEEAINKRDAL